MISQFDEKPKQASGYQTQRSKGQTDYLALLQDRIERFAQAVAGEDEAGFGFLRVIIDPESGQREAGLNSGRAHQ